MGGVFWEFIRLVSVYSTKSPGDRVGLWLLGVPVIVIIALHVFGIL